MNDEKKISDIIKIKKEALMQESAKSVPDDFCDGLEEKDIPAEPYKMDYGEHGIFSFCQTCGKLIAESKDSRCLNCGQMLKRISSA